MHRRSYDLVLVAVLAMVATFATFVHVPNSVLGSVFMLLLVVVVPGYALTAALFPARTLGFPEQLLLTLSLSLAVAALGGFVLNWTPWGLQANAWAALLSSVTLGACVSALVRRRSYPLLIRERAGLQLRPFQAVLWGLTALVVLGAIAVARNGASQQPASHFTQLWILPADNAAPAGEIRLGINNMEASPQRYILQVSLNNAVIHQSPDIALEPGQQWEATLGQPGTDTYTVEARLYRAETPTQVYRYGRLHHEAAQPPAPQSSVARVVVQNRYKQH